MHRKLTLTLTLLTALTAAVTAPAQSPGHDGPRPGRSAEMRKTLGLFFVHRARIAVELTDDQVLKLLPLVDRVEQVMQESAARRAELGRRLEDLAANPEATDAEVRKAIRELDDEESRSRTEHDAIRDQMLELLTPRQKARFVLFAHRLRRVLEEKMHDGRRRGERQDPPDAQDEEAGLP